MHWRGQGASLGPESLENHAFQAKSVILVKIEDGFHGRLLPRPALPANQACPLNVGSAYTIEVPSGGGQVLNRPSMKALLRSPPNVDPCVENGEFHRLVFDGPISNNPVGSPLAISLSLLLVLAGCRSNEMDGRWIFPKPRLTVLIAMVLVLSAA
jgi:hypothetical protein